MIGSCGTPDAAAETDILGSWVIAVIAVTAFCADVDRNAAAAVSILGAVTASVAAAVRLPVVTMFGARTLADRKLDRFDASLCGGEFVCEAHPMPFSTRFAFTAAMYDGLFPLVGIR